MNFLGIGPLEIGLVMVLAVIILGPERIPEVAVQMARAIKWLRGYATDATADLRAEMAELTKEYEEVRRELQEFRQGATKDMTSVTSEVAKMLEQARPVAAPDATAQPIVEPGGEPPPADVPPESGATS